MSAFKNAVNNLNTTVSDNRSRTANGGESLKSTLNPLVDLFFMIGSLRNKNINAYKASFDAAYAANSTLALQMILWARDIRGGAGERNTPRELLKYVESEHPQDILRIIPVLAEFGRWDDLLIFKNVESKTLAYQTIAEALKSGNGLCAKWMPRVYKFKKNAQGKVDMNTVANKNRASNNKIARDLMAVMNINERQYRKLLSSMSNTVEQKMCASEWSEIDYGKLPSVASSRYLPAFMKHDEGRYREYLSSLAKGEAKVNAGALYPYDITTKLNRYNTESTALAVAQWEALRNFMGDSKSIPMVDTSGSMGTSAGSTSMTCMDVAISLGLYIADKQEGAFKDLFLNFSTRPQIFELKGSNIAEKKFDLERYQGNQYWSGSTNIELAFKEILRVCVQQQVPADEMPKNLIVLTDMEFNARNGGWNGTAYEVAKADFESAGYELPTVVFWNLNARPGNNPVKFDTAGVALVSGFSPSVLEAVLSGEDVDPVQVMLRTIDSPRYQVLG